MDTPSSPSSKRSRSGSQLSDCSSKRIKVDEEVEEMLQVAEDRGSLHQQAYPRGDEPDAPLERDDTYYLHDGSCVMRIENTLFNVCIPLVECCLS